MKVLNRIVKTVAQNSLFDDATSVIDSTVTFNQGDLLCLDTGLLRSVVALDDGTKFVGISRQSVVLGKLKSPYSTDVDASVAATHVAGPVFNVNAKLVAKTGDAFTTGCKVYLDGASGTYHVTSTAGLNTAIGIYQGPAIAAASAGQEIEVYLKQNVL